MGREGGGREMEREGGGGGGEGGGEERKSRPSFRNLAQGGKSEIGGT